MRIGIFGYGSIGRRHFANLIEMGERDIMICDTAGMAATIGATLYNGMTVTNDVEDLWDWKPEAVLICTPPETHAKLAWKALMSGARVFCEKPLATTYARAQSLVDLANGEGLLLAVGYQLLACPSVQAFHRDWTHIHIWDRQNMTAWPKASYRRDILQEYSHELSLALYWTGNYPQLSKADWPSEELCVVHLTWSDGRTAMIELQAGALEYERGATDNRATWTFSQDENTIAYKEELRAFLDGRPYCTGNHAVDVVRLMEQLC